MAVTAIYASLLSVLLLVLSFRVISVRRAARVEIGEGGDRVLLRRIRVHANFVEYTPIALILLMLLESMKAPGVVLHALGATLLVGRVIHAYALSQSPHIMWLRVAGMVFTLTMIAVAAAGSFTLAMQSLVKP